MKTQNPLIGRSTKSIGENTFYVMNGQNIVRTKPFQVANPNTAGQQQQRTRFAAFTAAANSLPEAELEALFETKQPGRNRRTSLQAQIAPAYGVQANSDPTSPQRYVPTFDYTKLGDIGNGEVGYIGDLATATLSGQNATFAAAQALKMQNNVVNTLSTDEMAIVVFSEDGCVMRVIDTMTTLASLFDSAEEQGIEINVGSSFENHGNTVHAYVVKKKEKLQLIGLGTFSVAERKSTGSHNIPVNP